MPFSRRFPFVGFSPSRDPGNNVLRVAGLEKSLESAPLFSAVDLTVNLGVKIAFVDREHIAKTEFFHILAREAEADAGDCSWGQTITMSYFPRDNTRLFDSAMSIIE